MSPWNLLGKVLGIFHYILYSGERGSCNGDSKGRRECGR